MTDHLHALRPGTVIDGYKIVSVIGSGGFGITYLGRDVALDKPVAIKEYMPSDLAVRQQTLTVSPKSGQDKPDFDWGQERFLDEARTLARFDHPNVVKVSRFFRAHGTAYIVMEHVSGETLSEVLKREGQLAEAELRGLVEGLLSGLEAAHAANYLHRDIKPGNVILRPDGTPVLLDFGSARQSVAAKSRSVTAIVTPGYAPIEQYSSRGNQGPWTDIYAVGAICYRAMTGEVPVDATERVRRDPLVPVSGHPVSKGAYSPALLAAVDAALAFDEDARPQSVAEWRSLLSGEAAPTKKLAPEKQVAPIPSPPQEAPPETDAQKTGRRGLVAAAVFAAVLGASGVGLLTDPMGWFNTETDQEADSGPTPETPEDTETASVPSAAQDTTVLGIDEETATELVAADPLAPDPMGTAAERAAVIIEIQTALKTLGHYNAAVDGSSGSSTQAAVSAFGREERIAVPPSLSNATISELRELTARAKQAAAQFERDVKLEAQAQERTEVERPQNIREKEELQIEVEAPGEHEAQKAAPSDPVKAEPSQPKCTMVTQSTKLGAVQINLDQTTVLTSSVSGRGDRAMDSSTAVLEQKGKLLSEKICAGSPAKSAALAKAKQSFADHEDHQLQITNYTANLRSADCERYGQGISDARTECRARVHEVICGYTVFKESDLPVCK